MILEGLASPSQLVAADIGARTGIFSRWLGECSASVVAIEPTQLILEIPQVKAIALFCLLPQRLCGSLYFFIFLKNFS